MGGIGLWVGWTPGSLTVGLRRAQGLLHAGADGIEIFETDAQVANDHYRWVLPMFGDMEKTEEFLATSNMESCFPIVASTAAYGHDNHSYAFWGDKKHAWSMYEGEGMCL